MEVAAIWARPPDVILSTLPPLLAARGISKLWELAEPLCEAYAHGAEERLEAQFESMCELGKQMRREMQRGMQPSLGERLHDLWDRLTGREDPEPSGAGILAFDLPLIETLPTAELNFSDEAISAETKRQRDAIAAQISADRGIGPSVVTLPDGALDFMDEPDEWHPNEEELFDISKIIAYWPPVAGKPALALAEYQEDNGLPIELRLRAQDAAAHDAFVALLQRVDGRLE